MMIGGKRWRQAFVGVGLVAGAVHPCTALADESALGPVVTPGVAATPAPDTAPVATGHVTISTEPAQPGRVRVDELEVGDAPWSGDLPAGKHVVSIVSDSATSPARDVEVRASETVSVVLPLTLRPAVVSVTVTDKLARVVIDDVPRGDGGFRGELPAGMHRLRVEQVGHEPYARDLDLKAGATASVSVPPLVPMADVPVDEATAAKKKTDRGPYAQIGLWGLIGANGNNGVLDKCPLGASCDRFTPAGGALGFRIGYSFGWLGVEAIGLGLADASGTQNKYSKTTPKTDGDFYGPPRTETYTVIRAGGGGGIGARVTAPFPVFHPTLGVAGLLLGRSVQYVSAFTMNLDVSNGVIPGEKSHNSGAQGFVAPALAVDAGVFIGSSPGVKFHLGLVMLAEFDPTTTAPAYKNTLGTSLAGNIPHGVPALALTHGTQIFLAPVLGVEFGY